MTVKRGRRPSSPASPPRKKACRAEETRDPSRKITLTPLKSRSDKLLSPNTVTPVKLQQGTGGRKSRGAAILAAAGFPAAELRVLQPTQPPLPNIRSPSPSRRSASLDSPTRRCLGISAEAKATQKLQQQLPPHYALLLDMFAQLHLLHQMMKNRGIRVTYDNVRKAVEDACGRRFTVEHLAQLKYLYPEALHWNYIAVPRSHTPGRVGSTPKRDPVLVVEVRADESGAGPGSAPDTPSRTVTALRCEMAHRLATHLLLTYREWLAEQGRGEEEPIVDAATWDAGFQLAAAPGVPRAQLPPLPQALASPPLACPSTPPSTACPPPSSAHPPTTGLGKPPSGRKPGAQRARRLSFAAALAPVPDAEVLVPEAVRRQSMDGTLPFSLTALQTMYAKQAAEAAGADPAAGEARRRSSATEQLPRTFDALWALFSRPPHGRPLDEAVEAVRVSRGAAGSRQEALEMVERVAEAAPQWASLVEAAAGRPRLLRINPRLSGAVVRAHLLEAARAGRRASLDPA